MRNSLQEHALKPMPASRRRYGFTLVEVMLAASLMSLVFLAAMNLFLAALQAAAKSGAQLSANGTAANGLHHVEQDAREAYSFVLPSTLPAPNPPFGSDLGPGYPLSSFQTTYFDPSLGANRQISTGLKIIFPAGKTVSVFKANGAAKTARLYDLSTAGAALYIYRADLPAPNTNTPAVPDPAQGDCLWASGFENGVAVNRSYARLSDSRSASGGRSAANTIPNSVEFIKPPEASTLEIRLISSYFSPIGSSNTTAANQQSSQSNKTLLSGECVFMHDHKQTGN